MVIHARVVHFFVVQEAEQAGLWEPTPVTHFHQVGLTPEDSTAFKTVHKMGAEQPKHEPVRDVSDMDQGLKSSHVNGHVSLPNSVLSSHQKQQLCLENENFLFGHRTNYPSSEWLSHAFPDIICQRCCYVRVKPHFI